MTSPVLDGKAPKMGIRVTIDGRLRKPKFAEQAMAMAYAASDFIKRNLKYPSGKPVEVVIGETVIGGAPEADQVARQFQREGVGASLTVTPYWCYGAETMDLDRTMPQAVWGFNGTERPGAVYLAAVGAGHDQKGIPVFKIYGQHVMDAGDNSIPADVGEMILRFARAGLAVASMKGRSYLSVGGTSMGIAGSVMNPDFFEKTLGMRLEQVDMSEILGRMRDGVFDFAEYKRAMEWVGQNCKEGRVYPGTERTPAQSKSAWEQSVKMALIFRDMMVGNPNLEKISPEKYLGHNALFSGFQGQRQWTDHFANGDFLEAILNSSFDWNGRRQPYIVATENDALNGAAMLFGHLSTEGTAQIFADVRTYWSPKAVKRVTDYILRGRASGGLLHLINSGPSALDGTGMQEINGVPAIKPWYHVTDDEAKDCLQATTWHNADVTYFPGGGKSTRFRTRGGMPVTMSRVNWLDGVGPVLQIAEGYTVDLPLGVHDTLDGRTNPTWPTTWFVPNTGDKYGPAFANPYTVMNNWGANHGALSYGHIGDRLITLAAILRIPVTMHNVDLSRIQRPSFWSGVGPSNEVATDRDACRILGPLYGSRR